jgi:mono/diheme cytochrome c family protein
MNRRPLALLSALALTVQVTLAGEVIFSRDILPILSDHCFQCHGPDAKEGRKGELRLDDEADAKKPRDGYAVIIPSHPERSVLIERVQTNEPDEVMPPPKTGRPLSLVQKRLLEQWIREGAKWGKHWSFEKVQRPAVPSGHANPIDAFVSERLKREGMVPNGKARAEVLVRRMSLDLTGLPPDRQLQASAASTTLPATPDQWAALIDHLLAKPAFGERMAWDWLDAARYADSNGYQGDGDRTMWPWRDWVVRSFNTNLPFNQFTRWQLAGDLLPNATHEQTLATGFNRNHMINGEGGRIAEENRVDYVMDMTETTGTVWMGLTFNCCRCHDHKFDPLTQEDYYRLSAFFNQTPVTGGGGNPQTPPILACPEPGQSERAETLRASLAEDLAKLRELEKSRFPKEAKSGAETPSDTTPLPKEIRETLNLDPNARKPDQVERLIKHVEKDHPDLVEALKRHAASKKASDDHEKTIPKVMVMGDMPKPRPTFVLDRGLYTAQKDEVTAGVPASLPTLPREGSANRLALADWLVSREHPLTARVIVNRLWQMLFGIGLVKTPEDFGVQAEYPVHPELLDWLAAEFMESDWNIKHLLKLVLSSETYQRASEIVDSSHLEKDPQNRLLARGPRFRMPAWMLRDQALALSGLLNATIGGRPVNPYQPAGIWEEATFGNKRYTQSSGKDLYRRSIYTFWRRIVSPSAFFDNAKRQVCEVKPLRTNTPMQALALLNDPTFVESARSLATWALTQKIASDDARLDALMRRVLGRSPLASEMSVLKRSLTRATESLNSNPSHAATLLTTGEFKHPPEIDSVTLAAWTNVCLNLLNLDETLTKE